jgi:hypothetical protein
MAYTTINKSGDFFNTITWSGTGSGKSETGVGFQPDWVWTKGRTLAGYNHYLVDAVRGSTKVVYANLTEAEGTDSNGISAFNSDGYTFGTSNGYNNGSNTYVAWNWKANGQGSSNTAGSINTTYTSVNTTAGFSISKYTGTGSAATVGHGLGSIPNVIMIKRLDQASNWCVYHTGLGGADHNLFLNTTSAKQTDTAIWNNTLPTTSVFSLGANADANGSGAGHIAYCFRDVQGYSKFGSYNGNGNVDGEFVYTGFKPAFVIIKCMSSADQWLFLDGKRADVLNANPTEQVLYSPSTEVEYSESGGIDLISNGFKIRESGVSFNSGSGEYIFMAFAEAPLVGSNNIPATAR